MYITDSGSQNKNTATPSQGHGCLIAVTVFTLIFVIVIIFVFSNTFNSVFIGTITEILLVSLFFIWRAELTNTKPIDGIKSQNAKVITKYIMQDTGDCLKVIGQCGLNENPEITVISKQKLSEISQECYPIFFNYIQLFRIKATDGTTFVPDGIFSMGSEWKFFDTFISVDSCKPEAVRHCFDKLILCDFPTKYLYNLKSPKMGEEAERAKVLVDYLTDLLIAIDIKNVKLQGIYIYEIIKYGIARYFSDRYTAIWGEMSIDEVAHTLPETAFCRDEIFYHLILQNISTTPLGETYLKICSKINTLYENIRREEILEQLIGTFPENPASSAPEPQNESATSSASASQPESKTYFTISDIDAMEGTEFESFIAELFSAMGYKTSLTPKSNDYGIDVIAENDLIKIGIQAKRYDSSVSNSAVQEVLAGLNTYNLDKGIVITNNYFTQNAVKLAACNKITLWDRKKLCLEIEKCPILKS